MELAVISGKGGTGKSSVTAAFATLGEKLVVPTVTLMRQTSTFSSILNMILKRYTSEVTRLQWITPSAPCAASVKAIAGSMQSGKRRER